GHVICVFQQSERTGRKAGHRRSPPAPSNTGAADAPTSVTCNEQPHHEVTALVRSPQNVVALDRVSAPFEVRILFAYRSSWSSSLLLRCLNCCGTSSGKSLSSKAKTKNLFGFSAVSPG